VLYRRRLCPDRPAAALAPGGVRGAEGEERHPRALAIGSALCAGLLAGFVAGPAAGVAPWMVALGADAVLVAVVRRAPWPHVPLATAATAGALAVLASAAVGGLEVDRMVGGAGPASLARTAAVTAVAANLVNNLPALLVALPAVGDRPGPALWATLVGVNMGPVVLVTGSLASLLWLDALRRLGVDVHPRDFTRVGLQVGLPAAVAGAATLVVLDGLM
jgi:arsenical pump membrane protein